MTRFLKKRFLLGGFLLLGLSGVFWLNPLLEAVMEEYVDRKIVLHSAALGYNLDYRELDLEIFSEKLHLKQVKARLIADSAGMAGTGLGTLQIGRVSLSGINLSNFLWDDALDIQRISVDTLSLNMPRRDSADIRTGGSGLDSISLPGIDRVLLSRFELDHFRMNLLEPDGMDTISTFYGNQLLVDGILLDRNSSKTGESLVPDLQDLELQLNKQRYTLRDARYELYFDRFHYRHTDRSVRVDSLRFRPLATAEDLAGSQLYSFETYQGWFSRLEIRDFNLDRLLGQGELKLGAILIDSLHAEIFRDKRLPYDTDDRVALPDETLLQIGYPLRIDSVVLKSSHLVYREKLRDTGPEVLVEFPVLEGRIANLVSADFPGERRDTLKIDLNGNLLGTLPFYLNLQMPYATDDFFMKGTTLGSSGLHELNPTIYPAIGMRFSGGSLDRMHFNAAGNSGYMGGELTMHYTDLEVAFIKEDGSRKKTLSWLANTVIRNSNPNPRGRTIVGAIAFERVPYKGVWNYIWKGVQSGVENTLNPLGNRHAE